MNVVFCGLPRVRFLFIIPDSWLSGEGFWLFFDDGDVVAEHFDAFLYGAGVVCVGVGLWLWFGFGLWGVFGADESYGASEGVLEDGFDHGAVVLFFGSFADEVVKEGDCDGV